MSETLGWKFFINCARHAIIDNKIFSLKPSKGYLIQRLFKELALGIQKYPLKNFS